MSGMRGMAAAGGGGGRGRVSGGDAEAQRAINAEAPKIPHLFRRIVSLFSAHRMAIVFTMVLVLIGAALSVVPPLLTERAFDDGLFPPLFAAALKRHIGETIEEIGNLDIADEFRSPSAYRHPS